MQYSTLLALSSALMAAGAHAERVAVPYGRNPAPAAAMGPGMDSPWAISPPSAPSKASMAPMASSKTPQSMVSMHSSMKHSKPTIIPGMVNSAMVHPSMAPMAAMASSAPAHGSNRNQIHPQHTADEHRASDGFRAPQGGTHGIQQSSNGWHASDGLDKGSNGVGNTAGTGQESWNGPQGNEGNTHYESPRPGVPAQAAPPAQQPHGDQASKHHSHNQHQPAQAPQPPTHEPQNTNQTPDSPRPDNTDEAPSSPPHGGIAPVSPMEPGSNVAPMGFDHQNHGQDIGNAFCLGQCYPSEEEAKCGQPYASPMYKEELGCYTCCFTPGDF